MLATDGRSLLAVDTDVLDCCCLAGAASENRQVFMLQRLLGKLSSLPMGMRSFFFDRVGRICVGHVTFMLADFQIYVANLTLAQSANFLCQAFTTQSSNQSLLSFCVVALVHGLQVGDVTVVVARGVVQVLAD